MKMKTITEIAQIEETLQRHPPHKKIGVVQGFAGLGQPSIQPAGELLAQIIELRGEHLAPFVIASEDPQDDFVSAVEEARNAERIQLLEESFASSIELGLLILAEYPDDQRLVIVTQEGSEPAVILTAKEARNIVEAMRDAENPLSHGSPISIGVDSDDPEKYFGDLEKKLAAYKAEQLRLLEGADDVAIAWHRIPTDKFRNSYAVKSTAGQLRELIHQQTREDYRIHEELPFVLSVGDPNYDPKRDYFGPRQEARYGAMVVACDAANDPDSIKSELDCHSTKISSLTD